MFEFRCEVYHCITPFSGQFDVLDDEVLARSDIELVISPPSSQAETISEKMMFLLEMSAYFLTQLSSLTAPVLDPLFKPRACHCYVHVEMT